MAFSFAKSKSQTPQQIQTGPNLGQQASNNLNNNNLLTPNKLTSSQLNRSAKLLYPIWLKDSSSCLKQLPAIYHGVLGQVQLQPTLMMSDSNKFTTGLEKLVKQHQKTDYLNRFTDTQRVHQLLSTSRLSNEHLATIWAHVNKTFPGQLTNREVCLALALIAIFQQLHKDGLLEEQQTRPSELKHDPFVLVKQDKKAPVPTLYPNDANHKSSSNSTPHNNVTSRLQGSTSVPNDLGALLIDITDDNDNGSLLLQQQQQQPTGHSVASLHAAEQPAISLLDGDTQYGLNVDRLSSVWLRYMSAMKTLFKRTFDILNVESSRTSALEALKSPKGIAFCKNLSLCYPIAHNIAYKVDELRRFQERVSQEAAAHKHLKQFQLIDKKFATQINDLMISINEYWAVLINLFHECGLTNFIELIMDGLNRENETIESNTLDGLIQELDTADKPDLCSLCHTRFYLVNIGDALDKPAAICMKEDIDLVLSNELLSADEVGKQQYFYHVKCANFWLNNVPDNENNQLPFRPIPKPDEDSILKPTSTHVQ